MGARSMPSYPCAALGAIAVNADSRPSAPALIEPDGKTLSYIDLWQEIEAVRELLEGAGIGTGERVAVLLPQGALQILAVAGVLNHHVAIPLQAKTTAAEVKDSLRRLSASALIVSRNFRQKRKRRTRLDLSSWLPAMDNLRVTGKFAPLIFRRTGLPCVLKPFCCSLLPPQRIAPRLCR